MLELFNKYKVFEKNFFDEKNINETFNNKLKHYNWIVILNNKNEIIKIYKVVLCNKFDFICKINSFFLSIKKVFSDFKYNKNIKLIIYGFDKDNKKAFKNFEEKIVFPYKKEKIEKLESENNVLIKSFYNILNNFFLNSFNFLNYKVFIGFFSILFLYVIYYYTLALIEINIPYDVLNVNILSIIVKIVISKVIMFILAILILYSILFVFLYVFDKYSHIDNLKKIIGLFKIIILFIILIPLYYHYNIFDMKKKSLINDPIITYVLSINFYPNIFQKENEYIFSVGKKGKSDLIIRLNNNDIKNLCNKIDFSKKSDIKMKLIKTILLYKVKSRKDYIPKNLKDINSFSEKTLFKICGKDK